MLLHTLKPRHVAHRLCLGQFRCLSTTAPVSRRHLIFEGRSTKDEGSDVVLKTPFYLDAAYSIFAKRPSRPFPPPFLSTPSHSFSDPLTTHQHIRQRQPEIEGKLIRGITNGDDAIIIGSQNFLCVNDGVGAWAQKERGHAALWSRLIAHYWALETEKLYEPDGDIDLSKLDMVKTLQTAYEKTKQATTAENNDIMGTTTATSALLHHRDGKPVLLATQLGDCNAMVIRPKNADLIYTTEEQWHWFDCPRQLGTNSPDTPEGNAKMDTVDLEEGDLVLVASDGLSDNLWENEIVEKTSDCVKQWQNGVREAEDGVLHIARTLMHAAREIAQDPNAESPYMERAMDEGLAATGGKLDDISVVVGICRKRQS